MARALMNRMKFLRENQWISFLPANAPNKAPIEMQPVITPVAVCKGMLTLNTCMIREN